MKKRTWSKKIKEACVEAGTYRPYFDSTIDILASIPEKRDETEDAYEESGAKPLIEYTNKSGNTNQIANPALTLWDKLNNSALAYWRDLGLTPAGLKKIDETALKEKKKDGFASALESLIG